MDGPCIIALFRRRAQAHKLLGWVNAKATAKICEVGKAFLRKKAISLFAAGRRTANSLDPWIRQHPHPQYDDPHSEAPWAQDSGEEGWAGSGFSLWTSEYENSHSKRVPFDLLCLGRFSVPV